jgi:hypothetical protein
MGQWPKEAALFYLAKCRDKGLPLLAQRTTFNGRNIEVAEAGPGADKRR